jgi:hypothetical protein
MCIDPGDGTGTYPDLPSCQAVCTQTSFNCDGAGTCTDPGDGSGAYPDMLSCTEACCPSTSCTYDCVDEVWVLMTFGCIGQNCGCATPPGGCTNGDHTTVNCTIGGDMGGQAIGAPQPRYWLVGPDHDRTLIAVAPDLTEDDMKKFGYENPVGPCSNPDQCFDETIEEIV